MQLNSVTNTVHKLYGFVNSIEDVTKYMTVKDIATRTFRNFEILSLLASASLISFAFSSIAEDQLASWGFLVGGSLFMVLTIVMTYELKSKELFGAINWAKIKRLEEEQAKSPNEKPAALILTACADHNGALTCIGEKNFQRIAEIATDYQIFSDRCWELDDINDSMSEVIKSKQIGLLILNAHGSPNMMQLSNYRAIDKSNIHQLNFSLLAPNAKILLESCSVGKEGSSSNLAELFQFYAGPYRKIYAPNNPCYGDGIIYKKDKNFTFFNRDNKEISAKINVENILLKENYQS